METDWVFCFRKPLSQRLALVMAYSRYGSARNPRPRAPSAPPRPKKDPNSAYAQEQRDLENIDLESYIQMEANTKSLLEAMGEEPVNGHVYPSAIY
ncbi:hypothetical protein BDZ45DRAFT_737253 [Acephala macrosclerotiorum]|nr:hypothetical protein BDZ45DRAFT_737253 [Acephala macrosclerotiorum]